MTVRKPRAEGLDIPGDPFVFCQMTGFKCRYSDTIIQWDGRRVLKDWADLPPIKMKLPKFPNELKPFPKTGYEPVTTDTASAAQVTAPTDYPLGWTGTNFT